MTHDPSEPDPLLLLSVELRRVEALIAAAESGLAPLPGKELHCLRDWSERARALLAEAERVGGLELAHESGVRPPHGPHGAGATHGRLHRLRPSEPELGV